MQRRRFLQAICGTLLACKMALPLGSLPRVVTEDKLVGGLTVAQIRSAKKQFTSAEMMPPCVAYVHPVQYELWRKANPELQLPPYFEIKKESDFTYDS